MAVNTLTEFIHQHYDISYPPHEIDPEEIQQFLLTENHTCCESRIVNSLFINTFADAQDRVLIEAIPAGKSLSPEQSTQSCWLNTEALLEGWDAETLETLFAKLREI